MKFEHKVQWNGEDFMDTEAEFGRKLLNLCIALPISPSFKVEQIEPETVYLHVQIGNKWVSLLIIHKTDWIVYDSDRNQIVIYTDKELKGEENE
jgi:hypothetical protein